MAILSISGCSLLSPYQAELGQGNFIREEQRLQLDLGLTPNQVSFLLGTPLLTGEFPQKRWIYPTYDKATGYSKLIIDFENGVVSSITESQDS
ncbi:MAG: outer membrane protein assembly factor BamE [Reinekea sp.]